ncbi:MAG: SET domain-containing protein-lysine N-methyltransferase [Caldilineaceae bacterium]|nr:SET domain-containing protein-lysine N-methyltransferase [Caldilineaceae bacterium]
MTFQSAPITMWFDHRIVYRPSPIHGTGTFAIDDILTGQPLIWVAGGLVYTADDFHSGKIVFDGTMYNEAPLSETLRIATPVAFHYYINHSCEPNIIDQSRHPTVTHYVAMRDIHAGEELTADYYKLETLEVCYCNSERCRWKQRPLEV